LSKAGETDKLKLEAFSFVKQHAADPASVYVIVQAPNFMKGKDILAMIDLCSEDMQHTNTDFSMLREKLTKRSTYGRLQGKCSALPLSSAKNRNIVKLN
jgi:hypothetical protein